MSLLNDIVTNIKVQVMYSAYATCPFRAGMSHSQYSAVHNTCTDCMGTRRCFDRRGVG